MLPRSLKPTHCPLSYNAASVGVEMKDGLRSDWRKSQRSHRDDDGPGPLSGMYGRDEEKMRLKSVQ